jgi:hypothetical protein
MAVNYNAEQYEKEFKANRIQNWEIPKQYKGKNPKTLTGFTQFVANDKGHLLSGIPRSQENPWGNFVGTWDIPRKVPGNFVDVPTARDPQALAKLVSDRNDYQDALRQKAKSPLSVVSCRSVEAAAKEPARCACGACSAAECTCAAKPKSPARCACGACSAAECTCAAKSKASSRCACGARSAAECNCAAKSPSQCAGECSGCPEGCCSERSKNACLTDRQE